MPIRAFDEDANEAQVTSRPVPRGIGFRYAAPDDAPVTIIEVQAAVRDTLPGWEVQEIDGLAGWFEAIAPAIADPATATRSISLAEFWMSLRELRTESTCDHGRWAMIIIVAPGTGVHRRHQDKIVAIDPCEPRSS
jgi:hypothetical protein